MADIHPGWRVKIIELDTYKDYLYAAIAVNVADKYLDSLDDWANCSLNLKAFGGVIGRRVVFGDFKGRGFVLTSAQLTKVKKG